MGYLTIWDWVLTPLYLVLLVTLAKRTRNKKYGPGHPLRPYYLRGLYAKFGGAIFIGLVYAFYYGGGDTFNYFNHAQVINSSFSDSFTTWFKLITHASYETSPEIYKYTSQLYWYNAPAEYAVAVITSFIGLLTFNTYLPTAVIFAFISYSGIWAMYRTFTALYPRYVKPLAFAFLFIPSTIVWGSGIFKDTICMFGLGWLTFGTFRIFVNRDFSPRNILLVILSFYLVAQIKLYILMGFLPALVLWLLLSYSKRIPSVALRWMVNLFFIGLVAGGFLFFSSRFAKELDKYSLENITETANVTRGWTNFAAGEEGSTYSLGEMDGSLGSMLKLFPQGVVVSLFRPFPWEVKKVIVGLSALEALVFIYFTGSIFFNRRARPVKYLVRDPNILFCLTFALIFAFAVGISSGNFGALSRYKIPCLPFYGAMLAIMLGDSFKKKEPAQKKRRIKRLQPAI